MPGDFARRSFCTDEYLAGTPIDLIMAVSGYKTEQAFKKYIKVDHIKKAFLIKKLWDSQPHLQAGKQGLLNNRPTNRPKKQNPLPERV